jgi:hypothetical protein
MSKFRFKMEVIKYVARHKAEEEASDHAWLATANLAAEHDFVRGQREFNGGCLASRYVIERLLAAINPKYEISPHMHFSDVTLIITCDLTMKRLVQDAGQMANMATPLAHPITIKRLADIVVALDEIESLVMDIRQEAEDRLEKSQSPDA